MKREEIIKQLTGIFRKVLGNDKLILTNDLTADDVDTWDSLSHMLLITEIEDVFNIKFKLRELNKMKDVGVLIEIVDTKVN